MTKSHVDRNLRFEQTLRRLSTFPAPVQLYVAARFALRFHGKRIRREWVFAAAPMRIIE